MASSEATDSFYLWGELTPQEEILLIPTLLPILESNNIKSVECGSNHAIFVLDNAEAALMAVGHGHSGQYVYFDNREIIVKI